LHLRVEEQETIRRSRVARVSCASEVEEAIPIDGERHVDPALFQRVFLQKVAAARSCNILIHERHVGRRGGGERIDPSLEWEVIGRV